MSDVPIIWLPGDQHLWTDGEIQYKDDLPYRADLKPGTAEWSQGQDRRIAALLFVCPCGCGNLSAVTVRQGFDGGKHWKWNGNVHKPTLTPSIQQTGPCKWHGFLTDGVFVSV